MFETLVNMGLSPIRALNIIETLKEYEKEVNLYYEDLASYDDTYHCSTLINDAYNRVISNINVELWYQGLNIDPEEVFEKLYKAC